MRYQRFEVRFGGEPLEPGDWYVPATEAKNSLAAFALKLFEDKQRYKENGGPIYRFYKQKVNSFIGCFAQKNRSIIHLSH